jgi:hypothetical protein
MGHHMKAAILTLLAGATLLACPVLALADESIPDMKGDWVGKSYTIIAGSGSHWPTSAGTFEKPGLLEKDLVIRVTQQADRRFWGVTILSGNGEKTEEPFIGELTGKDHRFAVFVDTDGYWSGEINGDEFSFCYTQAGAVHEGKTSSVISCTEVRHQP